MDKETEVVHQNEDAVYDKKFALNVHLTWEMGAYIALITIALMMRFWDLGTRMLHHDESLHAIYSWYLYIGRGYRHDPMMHGPFQFHLNALIFFLFGVSDATARFLPAIFGTVLVGLPYFLRDKLGKSGAMIAALLLAFSPSFLYFSRFARNDIYVAVWSIALVILMFRYFDRQRPLYLYLMAAVTSLLFSTKEVSYITIAIFGSFLLATTGLEFLKLLRSKNPVSAPTEVMVLLGTFLIPLLTGLGAKFEKSFGIVSQSSGEIIYFLAIFLVLFAIATLIGLRWNPRIWGWCAVIFWGIFITLHSTVFSNPEGLGTGVVGALKYWIEQQGVARGDQPWYYYLVLLPIYEFVPIIFAIGGIIYFARKGSRFASFLIYWIFGSLILYGWAAEKMPWLDLHMALPLVLLAALTIGRLVEAPELRRVLGRNAAYFGILTVLVALWLFAWIGRPQGEAGAAPIQMQQQNLQSIALLLILLGLLVGAIQVARKLGRRPALQLLAIMAFIVLMPLSAHAAWQVTYTNGDVPVEMMVYTQTSPDVGQVMKEIERVGFRTATGKDLKVAYDSSVSWPFEWYLRDYKNRNFFGDGMPAPDAPIVLVGFENDHDARVKIALDSNYVGQRYKLRWWFPEDYRGMTFERIWDGITNPVLRKKLWNFFLYREPFNPLGSTDFMLYVRKDLAAGPWATKAGATGPVAISPQSAQPVQAPPAQAPVDRYAAYAKQITGAQVWGSKGPMDGQFQDPKGIAIGPDGSVFVLDTGNNRVQKFDGQGKYLLTWGRKGQNDGELSEPWGIAVDSKGDVYIADTWNHRIQKFDQNGTFLGKWGQFANAPDANTAPGSFFGPRGIAVDANGFVYITDTGNHRLQKFDGDGNLVASIGGRGSAPGQFNEPVGITLDRDGNLLIADTWNHRVQRFNNNLESVQQWPVSGWASNSVINKPYIAVDTQGNVFTSDPENNRVLEFAGDGSVVASWGKQGIDPASLQIPTGVAIDPTGKVAVIDSLNNRVMVFNAQ